MASQRAMRLGGSTGDSSGMWRVILRTLVKVREVGEVGEVRGGWAADVEPPLTSPNLSIIRNVPLRAAAAIRPTRRGAPIVPALARARRVHGPGRLAQASLRDRDPPAQRHGGAAPWAGGEKTDAGPADPGRADARPGNGVGPPPPPRPHRH